MNREEACAAVPAPASISAELIGYEWARGTIGESGGAVYRLHGKAGAADLYLKHGKNAIADDITDEMVRLRWLAEHVSVPAVRHFVRTPDEAWLLMTAVRGKTAYQVLEARPDIRPTVVDALAMFLRRLHAIPMSKCPFTSDHAYRLTCARGRIDARLVEEDDFDEEREGCPWLPRELDHCLNVRIGSQADWPERPLPAKSRPSATNTRTPRMLLGLFSNAPSQRATGCFCICANHAL